MEKNAEAEVSLFLYEQAKKMSVSDLARRVCDLRAGFAGKVRPPNCTMPCPDAEVLKVDDILIAHPNCNSEASRWVITCETGSLASMCRRCYLHHLADITPAILTGHTCVLGPLYTTKVLARLDAEKAHRVAMGGRLADTKALLHRVWCHADAVCDALNDDPVGHVEAIVQKVFGKRERQLRQKVQAIDTKLKSLHVVIMGLRAAVEVCGVQPIPTVPHPLYAHIHRSINSNTSVEEDLTKLLRGTIQTGQHRMAGLLAAKLLLLYHDSNEPVGAHLEARADMIVAMINAARREKS